MDSSTHPFQCTFTPPKSSCYCTNCMVTSYKKIVTYLYQKKITAKLCLCFIHLYYISDLIKKKEGELCVISKASFHLEASRISPLMPFTTEESQQGINEELLESPLPAEGMKKCRCTLVKRWKSLAVRKLEPKLTRAAHWSGLVVHLYNRTCLLLLIIKAGEAEQGLALVLCEAKWHSAGMSPQTDVTPFSPSWLVLKVDGSCWGHILPSLPPPPLSV